MERTPLTIRQIKDLCDASKARCDRILSLLGEVEVLLTEPLLPGEIAAPRERIDMSNSDTPALPAPRRRRRHVRNRGGVSDLAPTTTSLPPPPGMVTVKEARARADCTDVTIYKALRDGELKGQKLGPRRTMVWLASLDAWIAARSAPASPSAPSTQHSQPAPKRRGRPPKIPLSSILHSPAPAAVPYESKPRHNGDATPINPARFQPHD